jgi:hypothetical protein
MPVQNKFVSLSFVHENKSDLKSIVRSVTDLTYDALETFTVPLDGEPGFLTEVYLTGNVEEILESVSQAYLSKKIDCGWTIVE